MKLYIRVLNVVILIQIAMLIWDAFRIRKLYNMLEESQQQTRRAIAVAQHTIGP